MQRALGIDMTTPRSKSQQQIHSPSHQAKPIVPPQQTPVQQPPAQPKPQAQPQQQPKPTPTHQQQQQQQQQQHQQQHQQQQQQHQQQQQPYSQYPQSNQYPPTQQQQQAYPQPSQAQPSPGLQRHPQPQTGPSHHIGPQQGGPQQGFKSDPYSQRGPTAQGGPNQPRIPHPGAVPLPGLTKAPSQPDLGRGSPMHQQVPRQPDHTRSAGSSPAHRPQSQPLPQAQDGLTKLFGFGASLLNQASTLINVDPLPTQSTNPVRRREKWCLAMQGRSKEGSSNSKVPSCLEWAVCKRDHRVDHMAQWVTVIWEGRRVSLEGPKLHP
ncbi:hypothetical protein WMY93_027762 [Mugilogobius chulae]|uniref:Uncharacterized protein n=1 Tax=Mugilogobius chulae TaxID=88201 RepID=A0AAW0N0N4_9GOBI